MPSLLIINIKKLVGVHAENHLLRGHALSKVPIIENAYLVLEDGMIADFGPMSQCPSTNTEITDASGRFILPAWCDSHTHLVFAGSREEEFVDKIKGLSYAEINAKGGGILNSAKKLQETSEDSLFAQAWKRLEEISQLGTGAVEIKSGYGLSVVDELKMLRVIKKLKEKSSLQIKATFLGAHTYPLDFRETIRATWT